MVAPSPHHKSGQREHRDILVLLIRSVDLRKCAHLGQLREACDSFIVVGPPQVSVLKTDTCGGASCRHVRPSRLADGVPGRSAAGFVHCHRRLGERHARQREVGQRQQRQRWTLGRAQPQHELLCSRAQWLPLPLLLALAASTGQHKPGLPFSFPTSTTLHNCLGKMNSTNFGLIYVTN